MPQNTVQAYLVISATIFGLVAIGHLLRAINGWALAVGPITIPMSVSWIGSIATAALCVWAIRLATA
jgi:hypothetical protein